MQAEKNNQGQVAFVLKGYPRLSETFIAQEIHSLEGLGLDIAIYSLRHPTDTSKHPVHEEIRAAVNYLPEYLGDDPGRVFRGLRAAVRKPGFRKALATWWRDFQRDPSANRIRRFGQALVLAAELPDSTCSIHAHFLHTPASVARYAAKIRDLPWSCSAHAKDIWTSPEWEIREKLADCSWLTTCTAANAEYLSGLSDRDNVRLNYHGLDLQRFPAPPPRDPGADGSDRHHPVRLLSVGRAVSKKGYAQLLDALAALPKDLAWSFTHIGGGNQLEALKQQAEQLGLSEQCHWLGAQPQQVVLERYRQADLFVLNSQIDDNGDRDGLPNVIVEAQSQALAVLSTNISGIPELITHDENGLLVEQRNSEQLQQALLRLITHPQLRQQLGREGETRVRTRFDKDENILELRKQFPA